MKLIVNINKRLLGHAKNVFTNIELFKEETSHQEDRYQEWIDGKSKLWKQEKQQHDHDAFLTDHFLNSIRSNGADEYFLNASLYLFQP